MNDADDTRSRSTKQPDVVVMVNGEQVAFNVKAYKRRTKKIAESARAKYAAKHPVDSDLREQIDAISKEALEELEAARDDAYRRALEDAERRGIHVRWYPDRRVRS